MHWLRCIRWPNLVIIAFVQLGLYYQIIHPAIINHPPTFSEMHFLLLVVITLIIAASGYIINNIADIKTDTGSDKNPIPQYISKEQAYCFYFILIGIGAILSFYVAIDSKNLESLILYPLACLGLYYYSFRLKCSVLLGNFWIAVYAAGVLLIIPFAFRKDLYILYQSDVELFYAMMRRIMLLTAFASLANLCREIAKDMEDVNADLAAGCRTLVVKRGMLNSARVHFVFASLLSILFGLQCMNSSVADIHIPFHLAGGVSVLSLSVYLLIKPEVKNAKLVSKIYKIIFFAGTCYYLLFPLY